MTSESKDNLLEYIRQQADQLPSWDNLAKQAKTILLVSYRQDKFKYRQSA